ncbi:hypothetical protein TRM7557_03510 [Tritonibacter multivorans]|uniref:CHAD domain-containing protein n=1 Tax=Tritonibacter multivorans TaxID=928856 RepID=A0A0P1GII1_9RHOB|nr:hypothetical protein [Tritonibacter multivorans]MDA7420435.1 hypothetical protein [Tritonibacter multivorans]CUH81613.1 hypothetical protein TRM7557_03510 [Tritonibacter multivorans]SFC39253.1 hypothetical protein SAMN04488049_102347 [Tritonibacter multivorans]
MASPKTPSDMPATYEGRLDRLRSLYGTIQRARRSTEAYIDELEAEEEANPDTTHLRARISKLDGVLRDFQKLEKLLDPENADEPTRAKGIFDLTSARAEIERRLAGLAELLEPGDPAE